MSNPPDFDPTPDSDLAAAEQASAASPEDANLAIQLSHLLLTSGQIERAIETANRAARSAPNDLRVIRFLSGAQAVGGQLDAAIASGRRAVELAPDNTEAREHLGGLFITQQRPQAALPHLLAATYSEGATASAWRLLALTMAELGRTDRAIEAVNQALLLAPNDIECRLHLASLLIGQGAHDAALDELDIAIQQSPGNGRIWRARSGLFDQMHQTARALADAERAVELNPGDDECCAHLRRMQMILGIPVETGRILGPDALDVLAAAWMGLPKRRALPAAVSSGLSGAAKIQTRIIFSIMLRDMRTRFGHTRLGYVWAVVEPIVHLLTLGSVFAWLNHARPPLGNNLYLYYVTGLVPYLMFSHVSVNMISVLDSNAAILQLSGIKQTDVIMAKALLGLGTEIFVGILVFTGFALLGLQGFPVDLLTCMSATISLWFFALGMGAVNLVVARLFHPWEAIYTATIQLMYFASGIYYAPIMMPVWLRNILVWNPVLQGIEWFRSGFFANYHPHWLDQRYLLTCAGVALLLGFSLERALRKRMVVYT